MSLNSDFRNACIEHRYFISNFTGKKYNNFDDLQVCHILSKSKRTLNSIKKAYGCSEKTAELIMNMPLLNTVIGSRQDNVEYKKTDDIYFINNELCVLVADLLKSELDYNNEIFDIPIFCKFIARLEYMRYGYNVMYMVDFFKDIQLQFHREINLHT